MTPIYLRCAAGTVRWSAPRGALRVVLRHGVGGREFRGCIRLKNRVSEKVARVFVEMPGALSLLHTSAVRCFESRDALAALFIEATNLGPADAVFALEYDLEPLPFGKRYKPSDGKMRSHCNPPLVSLILTYSNLGLILLIGIHGPLPTKRLNWGHHTSSQKSRSGINLYLTIRFRCIMENSAVRVT